jgi:hypothetical protein
MSRRSPHFGTVDEHVDDVDIRLVELVPRARRHIGQGTRR